MTPITMLTTLVLTLASAPAQDADAARVEASSSLWREDSQAVRGAYRIVSTPSASGGAPALSLELGADFATKEGPDLKVVLSPLGHGEVGKKTALRGSLVLGLLKSNRGAQGFAIPEGTDLGKFRSVLIHCEKYTKLWAAAPLSAGEVIASGSSWSKKSNKVRGAWEIARVGERRVLRLGSNFKTKKGPDLKVVLSPLASSEVAAASALRGGVVLGLLKGPKGAQEFAIPADTDLAKFRSVLIHCEQYTKLWAASSLAG